MKEKVAIIDIGSNTIRLVIYEKLKDGKHFKEIENIKKASRLRTFLNEQQMLNEKGIYLLIEILQSFQLIMDLYSVTKVNCMATATIRQAANKEDIMQLVQEKTGLSLRILSEYEEANFGFLAVVHSIDIPEGITIDMGGGSTEISYFRDRKLVQSSSLPFGALSIKLLFVRGDVPTEQELVQIRQYIGSQLKQLPWLVNKHLPIIAMGGSARNMAQIHQNFIDYPLAGIHQYVMTDSDIRWVKERIEPLTFTELQNLEGLSKDRADTILPAVQVFDLLCEATKSPQFILSRNGLREGVLYSHYNQGEEEFTSLVDDEINELMLDYCVNPYKGAQLAKIASMFFEQIQNLGGFGNSLSDIDHNLLKRGAYIFHLGKFENEESGPYTFYMLANRTIVGLSHRERVKLALVASYKGKGDFRQYIEPFKQWFTKEERKKISLLGVILKLSQSLNSSDRNIVHALKVSSHEDRWVLTIQCHKEYAPEQYQLEKQKKHLEKLLKITVIPDFQLVNEG